MKEQTSIFAHINVVPDYVCPGFPDLSGAKRIAVDIETFDPQLREKGPGEFRDGYIAGISLATDDGFAGYYPIRHERGENLDEQAVLSYLRTELSRVEQPKVGANLIYDASYLKVYGVNIVGPLHDVLLAAPLIDDTVGEYSLQAVAERCGIPGKDELAMYSWLSDVYGGMPTRAAHVGRISKAPSGLVAGYAMQDARLPLQILEVQIKEMEKQGLMEAFSIESTVLEMLVAMRYAGVRVDKEKAEVISVTSASKLVDMQAELDHLAGFPVNTAAGVSLSMLANKFGIAYPLTATGKPQFQKKFIESINHKSFKLVRDIRRWSKVKGTFIDGHVLDHAVDGRIRTEFIQLPRDEEYGGGGCITPRFSCRTPNLQQIPKRDKEMLALMRPLFLPEEGQSWVKFDYDQIEPRLTTHYASLISSRLSDIAQQKLAGLLDLYKEDPKRNCYRAMAGSMPPEWSYDDLKVVYLGRSYGMGADKLALTHGLGVEQAKGYFSLFDEGAPYIGELAKQVQQRAENCREIRLLDGRLSRFNLFEPSDWKLAKQVKPLPEEQARKEWDNRIRVAGAYKALNRLIQGSAAIVMKKAMADVWRSGVCSVIGAPLLTIHDELAFSAEHRRPAHLEALTEVQRLMENTYATFPPMKVQPEVGEHWGATEKVDFIP